MGARFFADSVNLIESTVTDSKAYSTIDAGYSAGGGIWVSGALSISSSSISNNMALEGAGIYSLGLGNTSIVGSTISGNMASEFVVNSRDAVGGGIAILASAANSSTVVISNSTISSNVSENEDGGASISSVASVSVLNSTIAFNHAGSYTNRAAGLTVFGSSGSVKLESSILSNNGNSLQDVDSDLAVTGITVSGANNIVYASNVTLTGIAVSKCPLLGPLRDNGGVTDTHALLSTSPALATGNNSQNLSYDQRGFGFARTSKGDLGFTFTDMGAYEVQRADIVFNAGFEGCP